MKLTEKQILGYLKGNTGVVRPGDCCGHAGRVTLPARKRLNHRGPLSIDVASSWYFITICADGHAPWVGSRVPRDRVGRAVAPRPPNRTGLVVTTDDDTVNDTATRPENGTEPDQNPSRTRPKVPQDCPKTSDDRDRGDNKQVMGGNNLGGGDNKSGQGDNKSERRLHLRNRRERDAVR